MMHTGSLIYLAYPKTFWFDYIEHKGKNGLLRYPGLICASCRVLLGDKTRMKFNCH